MFRYVLVPFPIHGVRAFEEIHAFGLMLLVFTILTSAFVFFLETLP